MVPLASQPRSAHERELIKGLRLHLQAHLEERQDLPGATIAFRALYRLMEHRAGRPNYPEPVTWGLIEGWLSIGTVNVGEEQPGQPEPDEEVDP